jgi:hypothetical protein
MFAELVPALRRHDCKKVDSRARTSAAHMISDPDKRGSRGTRDGVRASA